MLLMMIFRTAYLPGGPVRRTCAPDQVEMKLIGKPPKIAANNVALTTKPTGVPAVLFLYRYFNKKNSKLDRSKTSINVK